MAEISVSCSLGRVAINHEFDREKVNNVTSELTRYNVMLDDKLEPFGYSEAGLRAYTDFKMQPVLDEYNAKQTRKDRMKTEGYCHELDLENEKYRAKGKPERELLKEFVLQFGDRVTNSLLDLERDEDGNVLEIDSNGVRQIEKREDGRDIYIPHRDEDGKIELDWTHINKSVDALTKALGQIKEKYPHADIVYAQIHLDEIQGTPHMHIGVQFTGEGYDKGLSQRVSISKALANDGIELGDTRSKDDYQLSRWTKEVQEKILEPLIDEFQLGEVKERGTESRKREDIHSFIRSQGEQTLERLQDDIDLLESEKDYLTNELREVDKNIDKSKKTLSEVNYEVVEQNKQIELQQAFLKNLTEFSGNMSDKNRTEPVLVPRQDGSVHKFTPIPELQRQHKYFATENRALREQNNTLNVQNENLSAQNEYLMQQNMQLQQEVEYNRSLAAKLKAEVHKLFTEMSEGIHRFLEELKQSVITLDEERADKALEDVNKGIDKSVCDIPLDERFESAIKGAKQFNEERHDEAVEEIHQRRHHRSS